MAEYSMKELIEWNEKIEEIARAKALTTMNRNLKYVAMRI